MNTLDKISSKIVYNAFIAIQKKTGTYKTIYGQAVRRKNSIKQATKTSIKALELLLLCKCESAGLAAKINLPCCGS
jgi:hypothetical protein